MEFTDWDTCPTWPCTPYTSTAQYSYNTGYLDVQKTVNSPTPDVGAEECKDRGVKVNMTHNYGLFYDETAGANAGDDVIKNKNVTIQLRQQTSLNSEL